MQKYAPMTIVHREGETEPAMREDSERGEFYYVADVDARIAELKREIQSLRIDLNKVAEFAEKRRTDAYERSASLMGSSSHA